MAEKNKDKVTSFSVGLITVITLVFIFCKLVGYLNWSWLWIFSPLWLPMVLACGIVVSFACILWLTGIDDDFDKDEK